MGNITTTCRKKSMINPILLHIWGPLAIHAYGLCIAIGVVIGFLLVLRDNKLKKIIQRNDLMTTFELMIVSGYIGGRIIFLESEKHEWSDYLLFFKFWQPGFSILGSIIGITFVTSLYLWYKKISILAYADRIALYAPLVQSFGRLGCFFAGCCFGIPTQAWWAVTYLHPDHMAPLNIALHPAQLYSSMTLLITFFILYFIVQHQSKTSGIVMCSYLICAGLERFLIDFIRWDRLFSNNDNFAFFSIHQWIGLIIIIGASFGIILLRKQNKKSYGSI